VENKDKLIEYNKVLLEENASLKAEIFYLQQEMAKIKRMIFGSSRERFVSSKETGMESLFDFPEEKEISKTEASSKTSSSR
jgi:hypothetical protein